MNKENLIKEYKGIPVKYSTGTGMLANYHRGNKTIYVYDGFFLKNHNIQMGIIFHEYGHVLFEKFSKEDKEIWEKISKYGDLYISPYAKKMSIHIKGPNEEFAESCRVLEQAKILKKEIKMNNILDVKLSLANFLKNKYELQKT